MMRHRLRLFTGDESAVPVSEQPVNVRLADISRALLDAARRNRAWLDDFADEEIQVSRISTRFCRLCTDEARRLNRR